MQEPSIRYIQVFYYGILTTFRIITVLPRAMYTGNSSTYFFRYFRSQQVTLRGWVGVSAALKALQAKDRVCYFIAWEKAWAIGKHLGAVVRPKYLYIRIQFCCDEDWWSVVVHVVFACRSWCNEYKKDHEQTSRIEVLQYLTSRQTTARTFSTIRKTWLWLWLKHNKASSHSMYICIVIICSHLIDTATLNPYGHPAQMASLLLASLGLAFLGYAWVIGVLLWNYPWLHQICSRCFVVLKFFCDCDWKLWLLNLDVKRWNIATPTFAPAEPKSWWVLPFKPSNWGYCSCFCSPRWRWRFLEDPLYVSVSTCSA